jgi:hypothetical protein
VDLTRATQTLRQLAVDLGAEPALGPVDLDLLEHGTSSDRGSEAMRAALWETVQAAAIRQLGLTRALLAPRAPALETLAGRLLEADDWTLSGPALRDGLAACGIL